MIGAAAQVLSEFIRAVCHDTNPVPFVSAFVSFHAHMEDHPETSTDSEYSSAHSNGALTFIHSTLLSHKLHWLPVSFQMLSKVLAITFKALCTIWPGYLWEHLSLRTSIRSLPQNIVF